MDIKDSLTLLKEFEENIKDIEKEKQIYDERNIFQKRVISPMYDYLKKIDKSEKKIVGAEINEFKSKLEKIVQKRIEEIKNSEFLNIKSKFDVLIPSDDLKTGCINPIDIVINDVVNFFKKINFEIISDCELTSENYCFDKLNIKKDHPARSSSDTFYVNGSSLLRVHNTAITSKYIEKYNTRDEIKVLSYGNVYRKDDDDATHSHQFNQIDLVWIKKGLSISNLKWITQKLLHYLFNDSIKIRYRLSYFPFTEPSFEVDISCFFCKGTGCTICKKTKWIEVLGAGILHPNVLKNTGIKEGLNGIAFGMGVDRIAMLKYQIKDIRRMYNGDFSLLRQFRGIK